MRALTEPRRRAIVFAFPSGRFLLGAVPADSTFADLVLPASAVKSTAGFTSNDRQNILNALAQDFMPVYSPCNPNAGPSGPAVAAAFGASLTKIAPGTGPAAPFVALAGGITSLFGAIFGAHAKAVGLEQATLCAAMPAANQFLTQIDQAFSSGQINASQASSLLDQVVQIFESGVAPIIKMTSSACNAACVYLRMLQAIAAKRKAQYADAEATAPASTSSVSSIFSSGPSSQAASSTAGSSASPLLWAAAAGLALLLLKGGV